MTLYPQLPHEIALSLADKHRASSIGDLTKAARAEHSKSEFTPTGGAPATKEHLLALREALLKAAQAVGFPRAPTQQEAAVFDTEASILLFNRMGMAPVEASSLGVWEFLTCILVPDLVRWRFFQEGETTSVQRFYGGRRNMLQRLWWRAFHLAHGAGNGVDTSSLLKRLGEDELVQLTERPRLAGICGLSGVVGSELLRAAERHTTTSRRTLIREGQKRLLRVSTFLALETMSAQELSALVHSIFDEVAGISPGFNQAV